MATESAPSLAVSCTDTHYNRRRFSNNCERAAYTAGFIPLDSLIHSLFRCCCFCCCCSTLTANEGRENQIRLALAVMDAGSELPARGPWGQGLSFRPAVEQVLCGRRPPGSLMADNVEPPGSLMEDNVNGEGRDNAVRQNPVHAVDAQPRMPPAWLANEGGVMLGCLDNRLSQLPSVGQLPRSST